MIFATYNVWNEEKGMGDRTELILQELTRIQADLVALQEVTPRLQHQHLARLAGILIWSLGNMRRKRRDWRC